MFIVNRVEDKLKLTQNPELGLRGSYSVMGSEEVFALLQQKFKA